MGKKDRMISLSAIGLDTPGLISKIMTEIFQMHGNIIDVEENCRRGIFSIFLVIDFSASEYSDSEIIHALKAIEKETGLKMILENLIEGEIYDLLERENYIVTILGVDQPGIVAEVSTFFYKYNINIENCRMIARGHFFSMEMVINLDKMIIEPSLSRGEAIEKLKDKLKKLCRKLNQSVIIQDENTYKRVKKIVVFDVESSLIHEPSTGDLLEKIKRKIKSINNSTVFKDNYEDKTQVLIENAKNLKGIPVRDLKGFSDTLQLKPGTLELIRVLKTMGFKIALLSSGFDFFLKNIFKKADVDYAFSNTLRVNKNQTITGELEEPVLTGITKNEILEFIMKIEHINRDQVIAVGDGSSNSQFIKDVGLSIAYNPDKETVKTDGILSSDQILNVLYCLGIPKTELDKYKEIL